MILFIDGSSLLSTNYYATLPREIMFEKDPVKKEALYANIMHASDGTYTNGILGFMRTLTTIMANQNPSHIFIAFDKTRATFRRELYSDYKGQRKDTPSPLKEQFKTIEEMLLDCGFAVEASDTYEADDLVGSAVELAKKTGEPIRIWTKDQDYFQLVSDEDNVQVWMPFPKDKLDEMKMNYMSEFGYDPSIKLNCPDNVFPFTEAYVEDHFGVKPSLVVDYKSIAGDNSDNIPGIKGVSSAAPLLLNEYGSLEAILEAIDECQGDKKAEKELTDFWKNSLGITRSPLKAFKEYRNDGLISKKLAKIKTDAPIFTSIDGMDVTNINQAKLKEWYTKLDMKSML